MTDKTVRVVEGARARDRIKGNGPDYCTLEGARLLLDKVRKAYEARGEKCTLQVVPVASAEKGTIYGLRTPEKAVDLRVVRARGVKLAKTRRSDGRWQAKAMQFCKHILETQFPGVTLEDVTSASRKENVVTARYALILAIHNAGMTEPNKSAIARFFKVDRTLVVRCIQTNGNPHNRSKPRAWLKDYVRAA